MTNGAGGHGRKKTQGGSVKKARAKPAANSGKRLGLVPPALRKRAEQ